MSDDPIQRPSLPAGPAVVAVPACRKLIESHVSHAVGEKYLLALVRASGVVPMIVPALGQETGRHGGADEDGRTCAGSLRRLLPRMDGLFLTGSPSNVEPHHYGGAPSRQGTAHDPHRDLTTFGLIEAALEAGMPILAVCRGLQELNVVLGGTLHQEVQELPGMMDHRAPPDLPQEVQYGPAHGLTLEPGGMLAEMAGTQRVEVNSLHAQAIDILAATAVVEARSDDGLIEGFSVRRPGQFVLAVQWHPEWKVLDNPFSSAIFRSFGQACHDFASRPFHRLPGKDTIHDDSPSDDLHRAVV